MADGIVHIVGAGLAGLSAAVRLSEAGQRVVVHEANPFAGGRCRSFHDPRLDRVIDNGNHLILSGNHAARAYLQAIGAADRVAEQPARFAFLDLADGSRWNVAPNRGPVPWWVFAPGRRVPGAPASGYLEALRLARAGAGQTVAEVIAGRGPLWRRFWEPLTLAALNTAPERASAALLWPVLRETFLRGERFCRPLLAPQGLGGALVEPAVAWLRGSGVEIRFGRVLRRVDRAGGRAAALLFADGDEPLPPGDRAVLAIPPWRLHPVLPQAGAARASGGILNLHFRLSAPASAPSITGLVSGAAHWIFLRGDVASVTVSAAAEQGLEPGGGAEMAGRIWGEVRQALALGPEARPLATRINWERRATFNQSPEGAARRPGARTALANLFLAGDFTATGLPATIEGAIRSGEMAARLAAEPAARH